MNNLKAPFPWFGGKSKASNLIWTLLGNDCKNYIEPFYGSGAVWLNRPEEFEGYCTVNDIDGNIANFWRSIINKPEETAYYACNPVNECDLHARHLTLVRGVSELSSRLMADPNYCDPILAGWWTWGACCWIGGEWCSGKGSWTSIIEEDGVAKFVNIKNIDKGVIRQLPHLGNGGQGVNRQLPHLGEGGKSVNAERLEWIKTWFIELSNHLKDVRVACGDWERICTVSSMLRFGDCAVVFDPPYSQTEAVYAFDGTDISKNVREWCKVNGENKRLKIVLCGHAGEHDELETIGWKVYKWNSSGYQGADDRERVWASPACYEMEDKSNQLSFI
jgi:site-specific DNA-adenine methylase